MRKSIFLAVLVLALTVLGTPSLQAQTVDTTCQCVCVDDARALDTCIEAFNGTTGSTQQALMKMTPATTAIYGHVGNCAATSTLGNNSAIIITSRHVAVALMKMVYIHDPMVVAEGAGIRTIWMVDAAIFLGARTAVEAERWPGLIVASTIDVLGMCFGGSATIVA